MDVLLIARDLVLTPIGAAVRQAVQFLPRVGIAAVVLALGIPLALLVREVTARLLRAIGLDVLSDRTGLSRVLARGGISHRLSRMTALVAYWVIIFTALILVFDVLEIPAGVQLIVQVLGLLPKLLALLGVVSLGLFLGRFVGRIIEASSLIAHVPFAAALGRLASYAVVGLAAVVGLRFVGFIPQSAMGTLAVVSAGIPILGGVIVLVGSRGTLTGIIAGRFLREQLRPGSLVSFDGIEAEIEAVELVSTRLRDGDDEIIISNANLASRTVRRRAIHSGGSPGKPLRGHGDAVRRGGASHSGRRGS